MMQIDAIHRTVYAELAQRAADARFASEFPPDGRFVRWTRGKRTYWYFDRTGEDGRKVRRYVGLTDDVAISERVAAHKELKADARQRRKLVSMLVREAYLPTPDPLAGDVVAALSDAGFFRLRGVLVGTVAYGCYPAHLGVRLPGAALRTGDADFAQFHSIAIALDDATNDVGTVLRGVDPSFSAVPDQMDGRRTTRFRNAEGYQVEFLTPNRSSDDHTGNPAPMPSLRGADATPFRFLDFLIHEPVRAVMLHSSGVPVTIPAPARYAVHKLIVAACRGQGRHDVGAEESAANVPAASEGEGKDEKDLSQAATLMRVLVELRLADDLADAWIEAWERGEAWRAAIARSVRRLEPADWHAVRPALHDAVAALDHDPASVGLMP